jgi:hypothetical protein
MISWACNLISNVIFTCLLIYAIEMSKDTLPGRFLIGKAVEFVEFLIELMRKIVSNNLTIK